MSQLQLQKLLRKYINAPRNIVVDIDLQEQWKKLDLRSNEKVTFAKLMETQLVKENEIDEQTLGQLFDIFDTGKNRSLEISEFKALANTIKTTKDLKNREEILFRLVDYNNQGVIDKRQFSDLWKIILISWSTLNLIDDGEIAFYIKECYQNQESINFDTFYAYFNNITEPVSTSS